MPSQGPLQVITFKSYTRSSQLENFLSKETQLIASIR